MAMKRRPLVIGNWKMELSAKAELELVRALKKHLAGQTLTAEVVVCPSFPSLAPVHEALARQTAISVGAQTVHWLEKGPWTGAVSVLHLSPYVQWCIVGHSEQRDLTGMSDDEVNQTTALLLRHGITPIVCLGETLEERQADQTVAKVTTQVEQLLQTVNRVALSKLVIAYEPIWAIGSGEMPEPADAAGTMLLVRKLVAQRFGQDVSERLRIVYGGSVKAATVAPFVAEPGVDGVLVGGASVHPGEFFDIIQRVQEAAA